MSQHADQMLIYQTLLDEAQGNVNVAFELAVARLAVAYHGVSWAYLYRMDPTAEAKLDRPATDATSDDWLVTAREG